MVVEVAVPLPIRGTFQDSLPDDLVGDSLPGYRVLVPFQKRHLIGLIVSVSEGEEEGLKRVIRLLDHKPILAQNLVDLGRWISWYYLAPLGESYRVMLPPGILSRKASPDSNTQDYWPAKRLWAITSVIETDPGGRLTKGRD